MADKTSDYIHLHVHSQYSLLDGACKIDGLVEAAKKNNMPALAITDHGNLFGLIEFYEACKKGGVKPILGLEAYVAPGSRLEKEAKGISDASYHLILLAKDLDGYKNLLKLTSIANLEGFYYRPRIDKEVLAKHSKGLMCLSSCLAGEVSYWLNRGERAKAAKAAGEYAEIFPNGDFYLEIQDHGIADQRKIIPEMLSLGKELKLPVVATNDLHYLEKSQARAHEALLCIQTATNLDDPKRFHFETDEFYFKSPEEMEETFKEVRQAVLNTREVAEKSNVALEFGKLHLPQFDPPGGKTQLAYLRELVGEGVTRRYPGAAGKVKERVEHEMGIISKTGFTSYFLITWDFVRYARSKGIPVGPGRGSAAGSVVSYCLGITDLDPLEHDLIFERFLNPDRISMPDIDIDFCYERRGEVIEYVVNKYGEGNVAQVITFGTMQAKAVVRDVARAMGFPYPEADKIAKMIPFELGITLKKAMELVPDLKTLYTEDPRVRQLLDTSMSLEGLTRHASTHAAGVVIADGDLTDYVPLVRTSEGQVCTGFAMEALEKIGLLKMDFLGLRTLTVLDEASKLIRLRQEEAAPFPAAGSRPPRSRQERGIPFDLDKIPMDDAKTFAMLTRGECSGVFQLESSGMRDLVRKLKPERFQDLIALVALFRPGPLGSGMVDDFIRRRHGELQVKYEHLKLEPILQDTYGVCIYQEQVMRIANEVAGFTLAASDTLRKAMGKKTPEVMKKARQDFVNGCVKHGMERSTAETIFDKIEFFAGYAFNRSHSAAYALIAYRTAYLKANYPAEFMTALLTSERDNTDKIAQYIEEARRMEIPILPPDINGSFARFTVENGGIRYGLLGVKNIGEKAIESIVQAREEKGPAVSLAELCERVDTRAVNRKVLESLIKCGALDSLKLRRSQQFNLLDQVMDASSRRHKETGAGQLSFFDVFGGAGAKPVDAAGAPEMEEWPQEQLLAFEKQLLGFYLTGHPLAAYDTILKLLGVATAADLPSLKEGSPVTLGGVIAHLKVTTTKRGNERMAIVRFEDFSGDAEVLVFPKVFPLLESNLKEDAVVLVRGKLSAREDRPRIFADEIIPLEEAWNRQVNGLSIRLAETTQRPVLEELKAALGKSPGQVPVELSVGSGGNGGVRIAVGSTLRVNLSPGLLQTLVKLVGSEALSIRK